MFYKKKFLKILQNLKENISTRAFFNKVEPEDCNFTKKRTLAQEFLCKFCGIFKNTFFTEHHLVTTSGLALLGLFLFNSFRKRN